MVLRIIEEQRVKEPNPQHHVTDTDPAVPPKGNVRRASRK